MAFTLQTRLEQVPRQVQHAPTMQSTSTTKVKASSTSTNEDLVTKQKIEQRQSFELIQTLMLVSFTSLCYLRNLLPIECFEERDYEAIRSDAHWAYDDFVSGHIPSRDLGLGSHAQVGDPNGIRKTRLFRIISRGRSVAADKLHLWLDGISDALMRHFLASVQLNIILDKKQPSEVVESYTFTFNYEETHLKGLAISSGTRQPVTIKSAKHGLNMMIRYLIELIQTLPDLPETRFLTLHLFYRDHCPLGYNPPGFRANESSTILVADSDLWKMNKANLGHMDTIYHRVNLSAAFLTAAHDPETMSADDVPIPSDLQFTRQISWPSDISPHPSVERKSTVNQDYVAPSDIINEVPALIQSSSSKANLEASIGIPHSLPAEVEMRTDSQDLAHQELEKMLRSSPLRENLTQTQLAQLDESQLLDSDSWELTLTKCTELWPKRERYLRSKDVVDREDTVHCACGFKDAEGEMVRCDCCNTLQHKHCYGLKGKALGKANVCYVCLLEDCEPSLLPKMQDIARKRRTCWIIEHGHDGIVPSDAAFAKLIGLPTKQFTMMLSRLNREGLVKTNRDSRRAGFKATGAPRLILCQERARTNYQEFGFLHPLAAIQHYYQKCDEDEEMSSTECETEELVNIGPVINPNRQEKKPIVPATPQKRPHQIEATEDAATNARIREEECQRVRKRLRSSKAMSPLDVSEFHDKARSEAL